MVRLRQRVEVAGGRGEGGCRVRRTREARGEEGGEKRRRKTRDNRWKRETGEGECWREGVGGEEREREREREEKGREKKR